MLGDLDLDTAEPKRNARAVKDPRSSRVFHPLPLRYHACNWLLQRNNSGCRYKAISVVPGNFDSRGVVGG